MYHSLTLCGQSPSLHGDLLLLLLLPRIPELLSWHISQHMAHIFIIHSLEFVVNPKYFIETSQKLSVNNYENPTMICTDTASQYPDFSYRQRA